MNLPKALIVCALVCFVLAVLWRGTIWHQVLTFNQPLQPQLLSVDKPEMPI